MIQIDMQMPTNCLDCPACNEYLMCAIPVNGRKWGENDVREFGQDRPEWCPLKEQVRCKDCKHYDVDNLYCDKHDFQFDSKEFTPDWFCADGRKKEDVQLLEYADQDTAYYANQEVLRPLT